MCHMTQTQLTSVSHDGDGVRVSHVSVDVWCPGDSVSLLESAKQDVYTLCSHVHQFAFDIVFAPLKLHLADVPTMPVSLVVKKSLYLFLKASVNRVHGRKCTVFLSDAEREGHGPGGSRGLATTELFCGMEAAASRLKLIDRVALQCNAVCACHLLSNTGSPG